MQRFWNKVNKTNSCWLWTAGLRHGYGHFAYKKSQIYAHRLSYILHKGKIPKGLFVCHSCNNRLCVNPEHLYAGTQTDNMQDRLIANRNPMKNKTHCKQGHKLTKENTYLTKQNWRQCKTCKRKNALKRYHSRKKAQIA